MQSTIHLFNTALGRLGGEQLPLNRSPQEDDATGSLCENFFPHVLDLTLAAHEWGFARRRVYLAGLPHPDPANPDYRFKFALPADCVRPIRLDGSAGVNRSPLYVIEGDSLLCDEAKPALVYIARITDPKIWPPAFADALAWGLAGELASARLNFSSKQQLCYQNYRETLADAIVRDLSQQNPRGALSPWAAARGAATWFPSEGRKK